MCSVQEERQDPLPKGAPTSVDRRCMKCGQDAVAIGRIKDPFCRDCFKTYFTHRFRASFGRSKLIRQGEKVFVAYSGGKSSRVLLKLVEEGLERDVLKKLRFIPSIIYVDESAVLGHPLGQTNTHLASVLTTALKTGFPVYFTRLEEVFGMCSVHLLNNLLEHKEGSLSGGEGFSQRDSLSRTEAGACAMDQIPTNESSITGALPPFNADLIQKLQCLFKSLQTTTAKDSLLHSLRCRLLIQIALEQGFSKILVGENATRLAAKVLGNVAEGRGGTLPLDTGFCDDRAGVTVLRPLREFPETEIACFVSLHQLEFVEPSVGTAPNSIQTLAQLFVNELQTSFPSTITTILRTGDKLTVNDARGHQCSLCQTFIGIPLDDEVFSHLTLSQCFKSLPPSSSLSASSIDPLSTREMWDQLCYGCKLTIKDSLYGTETLSPLLLLSKLKLDKQCSSVEDK